MVRKYQDQRGSKTAFWGYPMPCWSNLFSCPSHMIISRITYRCSQLKENEANVGALSNFQKPTPAFLCLLCPHAQQTGRDELLKLPGAALTYCLAWVYKHPWGKLTLKHLLHTDVSQPMQLWGKSFWLFLNNVFAKYHQNQCVYYDSVSLLYVYTHSISTTGFI